GFELLLRLGGEAWCPQRPHAFHGPQDMVMEKNWMVAADNVLKRYKKWKGKTALSYIAIWSEFPGVAYWDRTAQEFVAFWTKAINVFKYNHPDLKFGGPGFSAEATDEVRRGISGVVAEFLKQLYLRKTKPDWIGWHLYANDPSEALEAARAYELLLAGKAPFQNVPWAGKFFFDEVTLLVDSYGVRTANEETTQIADGAREAAIVTGHWIAFEHTAVMGAWLYRANNIVLASASDEQPAWSQGLFKADLVGTYTPKAHAFRLWSRMAKEFGHKLQTPPYLVDQIAQQKLWVLAGQAASGKGGEAKVGVLLANPGAQPVSFTPILKQIKPKGALYVVDGVDNGRSAKAWEGTNIVVPPRSVVLATFE
ncbi:MAG: glycoside hydrolase family protein, partial [uncultured bacterium]